MNDNERTYTATLVMEEEGGRVTLDSGPHPSADTAINGLAALAHRLNLRDRVGPAVWDKHDAPAEPDAYLGDLHPKGTALD